MTSRTSINLLAVLHGYSFFCTVVLVAIIVLYAAVVDFFGGRYRLWPSSSLPVQAIEAPHVGFLCGT